MKLEGAIFDVDGTLLDSMPMWDNLAAAYLRSRNIVPEPHLNLVLKSLTVEQAARYFQKQYGIKESIKDINTGVFDLARHFYLEKVVAKPGVEHFLHCLAEKKIPMCIATATDKDLVLAALERNKLAGYFVEIVTCAQAGGKTHPDIFVQARAVLGTPIESTYVFEDAYYAIKTAKQAGFPVVAVYDDSAVQEQKEILAWADKYVHELTEMEAYLGL